VRRRVIYKIRSSWADEQQTRQHDLPLPPLPDSTYTTARQGLMARDLAVDEIP